MNKRRAKLLTTAGIFSCVFSLLLLISGNNAASSVPQILLPLFFVGGIVLIFLSLAYYTDK